MDLATKGSVSRQTQIHYESGKRSPDARYWAAIAKIGVDVQYVLTGVRSPNVDEVREPSCNYRDSAEDLGALSRNEREWIRLTRDLSRADAEALRRLAGRLRRAGGKDEGE